MDYTHKVCVACLIPRSLGSFYTEGSHPKDTCKPCIHRPGRTSVKRMRNQSNIDKRTQEALRYFMKYAQAEGQSFVYLIDSPIRYKIGYSTNVSSRFRQLGAGSAHILQLAAVVPGGRQLEQSIHLKFNHLRIHGEWFAKRDHILNYFVDHSDSMVFLPGYLHS